MYESPGKWNAEWINKVIDVVARIIHKVPIWTRYYFSISIKRGGKRVSGYENTGWLIGGRAWTEGVRFSRKEWDLGTEMPPHIRRKFALQNINKRCCMWVLDSQPTKANLITLTSPDLKVSLLRGKFQLFFAYSLRDDTIRGHSVSN